MSQQSETALVSKAPSDGRPSSDRFSPRDTSLEAPRLRTGIMPRIESECNTR